MDWKKATKTFLVLLVSLYLLFLVFSVVDTYFDENWCGTGSCATANPSGDDMVGSIPDVAFKSLIFALPSAIILAFLEAFAHRKRRAKSPKKVQVDEL